MKKNISLLKISKEEKEQLIAKIQYYFESERNEELGNLAAEFILDFFVEQIGPFIYNQAVDDVQVVLNQKMASFEEELYSLKRPVKIGK